MRYALALVLLALPTLALAPATPAAAPAPVSDDVTGGELRAVSPAGALAACPLRHTDVKAEVSGFVARVTVTQQFENPFPDAIEAVYLFPLAGDAAVDRMTMTVGDRVVHGTIARRAEARATYEAARATGRTASLLEQERPNVFTQSVANIPPAAKVEIAISYVQTLAYQDGAYRLVVPMTVGSRYAPSTLRKDGTSSKSPTAGAPAATLPGHDVSVEVALDAGVPLVDVTSPLHEVSVARTGPSSATVKLATEHEIPNRDFVLRYAVAGGAIEDALITHRDERGGFFTLILQPPARVAPESVTAKEIVFAVDASGSMQGAPMETAKATVRYALERLSPDDTFNVVAFAGVADVLFKEPVAATAENRAKALKFLDALDGRGGTEMLDAVRAALSPSDRQDHVRVVCFLTDGYVGNDLQILAEVQKHPNARVFALGVGDATNRFLLDKMAEEGRGDVAYVGVDESPEDAARRFFERVRNPLLTDVSVDWNGLDVSETYPARTPDVFSSKPVVVTGRYTTPGAATIRLVGRADGREVVREIPVVFPESAPGDDAVATIWARRKVDDLMRQDYAGVMKRAPRDGIDEQIAKLGLDYSILTQFTSFVAVDDAPPVGSGAPAKVAVPGATPAGATEEFAVVTRSGTSSFGGIGVAGASASLAKPVSETTDVVTERSDVSTTIPATEIHTLSTVGRSSLELLRTLPGTVEPVDTGSTAEIGTGSTAADDDDEARFSETVTVTAGESIVSSDASRVVATPTAKPAAPAKAVVAEGAHPAAAWKRAKKTPGVEIVFAVDTTGSMENLLDGAKRRIWGIVNEIMRSPCHPSVRIGIVAYRDRGDAYESQILPLTSDLDLVYATLAALKADGGGDTPEDVRRGLADAVDSAGWSPAAADLAQVIFLVGDAPPHDYPDLPSPEASTASAARRGIVVHAIQCGTDAQTKIAWETIASGGGGSYFAVPSDRTVATVERTPYDGPLADLGKRLGDTYTPYGSSAEQRDANARQARLERTVARREARTTAADRAVNKAVNAEAYSGDFLQAIENGTLSLDSVPASDLPEDLRGLSPARLRAEVAKRIERRRTLRAAILDISRLRDQFVAQDAPAEAASLGFDAAVGDAVKKHLARKGMCQ